MQTPQPRRTDVPKTSLLLLLFWLGAALPAQAARGPERLVPARAALALLDGSAPPTRVRWLLAPADAVAASAALHAGGVELVARLPRFGDLWILEADADSAQVVEARWSSLGTLRRDRRGHPALVRSTALVGVRDYVWSSLDLRGDSGSAVAILDSGCDTAHDDLGDPDFDNADDPPTAPGDADDWVDAAVSGYASNLRVRVVGWHDVTDDLPNALGPYDYHRHGTAMAGAAFGSGRVESQQRGVAPEGRIVVVKIYNFEDRWEIWASDFLLGIDWLLANAASLGVRACLVGVNWDQDLGISAGVAALTDAGIAVIAPSGNDPTAPMGWPARLPEVITVGATDVDGRIAAYSTPGSVADATPDLVAPGGSFHDPAAALRTCDNEPNDTYRGRVGTSLAAAHVAGAVSLISQALTESGRPWRSDRAQTQWLQGLLRATALETAGAEPGALGLPRLDRGGHDAVEGYGLLQVDAAVDAVRRVLWPGERVDLELGDPVLGAAVWAARMPVMGDAELRLDLFPPAKGDFDLLLYREEDDGIRLAAASTRDGLGVPERLRQSHLPVGHYLLLVKRIRGEGIATLLTDQVVQGDVLWPIQLSAAVTTSPLACDVDGDGGEELVLVNNVAVDPSGHTFHVFRGDGRAVAPFPRTFFSASDRVGGLTAPAVADLGGGLAILAGSEFGEVYAVGLDGSLLFDTDVDPGRPVTAPAVWQPGASARLVVGTSFGAAVLDAAGGLLDRWVLGAAAAGPPALGDLDGDGVEEVVIATRDAKLHARRIDGSLVAGWPVVRPAGAQLSPVRLLGENAAAGVRVAATETRGDGSAWALLLAGDGSLATGFPAALTDPQAVTTDVAAGCTPSRLTRGGPVVLLVPAVHSGAGGDVWVRLHRVGLDGSDDVLPPLLAVRPLYAERNLSLASSAVASVRVADAVAAAGAEVWVTLQLAWQERAFGQVQRFGSLSRLMGLDGAGRDPRLDLALLDGHLPSPPVRAVAPLVADLDGDGRAELVVARGNRLYLQSGRQPTSPRDFWWTEGGDARGTRCYACTAQVAVATPAARPLVSAVRVHPNPFNPRAIVELTAAAGGTAQLTLLDARGRRLRVWRFALPGPGTYRQVLTAEDDAGRPLASGVYRLVAEVGRERLVTSVTLLR